MYFEHFGLNSPPFKITPDTHLFFSGGKRGLVLDALIYAILHGEGIVKVVGEVGSGKTMLCRMLAEKLPAAVEVVYLTNPHLTPDTILQAVALELNLPIAHRQPPPDHLQTMQALHRALLEMHAAGRHVVALVEEAQNMPVETLEEIRLLSNLETGSNKLLQIVLFGQPELEDNLAGHNIRQLRDRITHSFYLTPLKFAEITEYLEFRMRANGYRGPSVFSPGAVRLLCKNSQGLLRRVNILADKALLAVYAAGGHAVEPRHMRQAIRDSGFLDYRGGSGGWWWIGGTLTTALAGVLVVFLWQGEQVFEWLSRATATSRLSAPPVSAEAAARADPQPADAPLSPAAPVVPDPVSPSSPPLAPALLSQRLAATPAWLEQETGYTLQVMNVDAQPQAVLEKLLQKAAFRALHENLYLLRSGEDTNSSWLIFFGDFREYQAATEAIEELPPTLKRYRPFVRNLRYLRENFAP